MLKGPAGWPGCRFAPGGGGENASCLGASEGRSHDTYGRVCGHCRRSGLAHSFALLRGRSLPLCSSLARDEQKLIPFIKAAMAVNPKLTLWAVPWTGPSWLKDSDNYWCGTLRPEPKYQAAYALYLAKAAKAYRAAGLNLGYLVIQNEPAHGGLWNGSACPKPTCK